MWMLYNLKYKGLASIILFDLLLFSSSCKFLKLDSFRDSLMGDYMFSRQETSTIQVCEESSELCSTASKHMEDDNVDKACVSDTDLIPVTENIVELDDDGVDIPTVGDTEWDNPHSSEVSDVREVTTEPEENSLDIPVDTRCPTFL